MNWDEGHGANTTIRAQCVTNHIHVKYATRFVVRSRFFFDQVAPISQIPRRLIYVDVYVLNYRHVLQNKQSCENSWVCEIAHAYAQETHHEL